MSSAALAAPAPSPPVKKKSPLGFILSSFGPLIVFYAVDWKLGLMWAIAATAAWSVGDVIRHVVTKKPITSLFKLTAAMTLVFGAVDLFAQKSILFKYEACVTNVATAVFFALTLRGKGSALEDAFRQSPKNANRTPPDWLKRLFRVLTWVWVGYFLVKAVVYAVIAQSFTLEQAMGIRAIVGNVSLVLMIGVSVATAKLYKRFFVAPTEIATNVEPA